MQEKLKKNNFRDEIPFISLQSWDNFFKISKVPDVVKNAFAL